VSIFFNSDLLTDALSLFVGRPESVFIRETRFVRDKYLGTEGVST
jgi:hypothetical protein